MTLVPIYLAGAAALAYLVASGTISAIWTAAEKALHRVVMARNLRDARPPIEPLPATPRQGGGGER